VDDVSEDVSGSSNMDMGCLLKGTYKSSRCIRLIVGQLLLLLLVMRMHATHRHLWMIHAHIHVHIHLHVHVHIHLLVHQGQHAASILMLLMLMLLYLLMTSKLVSNLPLCQACTEHVVHSSSCSCFATLKLLLRRNSQLLCTLQIPTLL